LFQSTVLTTIHFHMNLKSILLLLLLSPTLTLASKVDTLMVQSKSMNKSIANVIITPEGYASQKEPFDVLYLLHGAYGNHKDWLTKADGLEALADQHNIIIVCPDGGFNSWYFDSPIQPEQRYETYISKELISAIDNNYKTNPNKNSRAVAGLSMGGHGAFYLSFKHQDVWGAAGSMSGGLDIRPFPNNWSISERLGSYAEHKENWENNTVTNMVHLLDGVSLSLIFDCGVDDFFYGVNKRFHEKLLERNISHDYIERPGKHNWEYWTNSIKYQMIFFDEFFKSEKSNK
jgi:S-formylglutathione hydrolase FrmB